MADTVNFHSIDSATAQSDAKIKGLFAGTEHRSEAATRGLECSEGTGTPPRTPGSNPNPADVCASGYDACENADHDATIKSHIPNRVFRYGILIHKLPPASLSHLHRFGRRNRGKLRLDLAAVETNVGQE
jgi:hypothetical protein